MMGLLSLDKAVRVRALVGKLCCVPGQDTLLSQCYSPCGKIDPCDGLASNSSNSNEVNVVVVVVVLL